MTTPEQTSGIRKAAIFLVLLGDDASSSLFHYLSDEEIQEVSKEISRLGKIEPETADSVLDDYYKMTLARSYLARGGAEYAKKLLIKAFGADASKRLLDRVTASLQSGSAGFDYLQKADPQQVSRFIQSEHPQTIALVLAHMEPERAAALLGSLPAELQGDVVMRLAGLEQISPEIVSKISSVLAQKLQSLGELSRESRGGIRAVAELINRMDSKASASILESIETDDPDLALRIRNFMFVFDDILLIDDMGMREIIQRIDKKTLTVALKGTSEEVKGQFFRNMSKRAVEMLREDMEVLGPVKIKEVELAQQEIIMIIRKLDEDGVLSIKGSAAEEYVS
ncbi:MAG: flagellar motor switch protein FliG [Acidobacteriota bacterium]